MQCKQEKPKVGIDGFHTLSLCDIRHPKAKILENEIVRFSDSSMVELRKKRGLWYTLKAKMMLGMSEDEKTVLEQIRSLTDDIQEMTQKRHETLKQMYQSMRDISLVQFAEVHNIIPTAGRSVIARWIIGDNTYSGDDGANYGSLGTSATAPANGDTQLTAETYRKATSSTARSNNIATLSNFYTATEVTGTFEEAGWHIAGTGAANSGQLLSHFLTTTIVKAVTETLVVESALTIS